MSQIDTYDLVTGNAVVSGIAAKVTAFRGVDDMERRVERLKDVVESTRKQYVTLVYDIPTAKNADCPNPSRLLWGHGFRLNFSCWVMPKGQLEAPAVVELMGEWKQHGIKHYVIEYAESQMDVVRAIAQEKLDEELRRVHTSLIECIMAADDALKTVMAEFVGPLTPKMEDNILSARDNRVRARINLAIKEFRAALKCAELFDESENLADLFAGVRSAIIAHKEAFNATAEARSVRQVTETI